MLGPRRTALTLGLLGLLGLTVSPAALADFNARGRAQKSKPAATGKPLPAAPGNSANSAQPSAVASSNADAIARYTALCLAQPGAETPLQKLSELYRNRDGNLQQLFSQLKVTASSLPSTLNANSAERYAAFLALSWLEKQAGKFEAAKGYLDQALSLRPGDLRALSARAALEESAAQPEAARSSLEQALKLRKPGPLSPEFENVARKLLQLCLDLKDYEAAKSYHTQLLQGTPAAYALSAELGRELLARKEWARAETEFRKLAAKVYGDPRAELPALKDLATAELAQGKHQEARASLERALGRAPDSGQRQELLTQLSQVYRERGDLPGFLIWLKAQKRDAVTLKQLALLSEETGQLDSALAAYQEALKQKPGDVELQLRVIHAQSMLGRLPEVITAYEALIRSAPHNAEYVLQLCNTLIQRGEKEKALQRLTQLEARSGQDPDILRTLVEAYERLGETQRSRKLLESLATRDPSPETQMELGMRFYKDGDTDRAVQTWEKVRASLPKPASAGTSPSAQPKNPAAIGTLRRLGELYLEHDQSELALMALRDALALDASSIAQRRALADALERAGTGAPPAVRAQRYREASVLWEQLLNHPNQDGNLQLEASQHLVALWFLSETLTERIRPLERNFSTNPPDITAGRLLALAYERLRKFDQATRVLSKLAALRPQDIQVLRHSLRILEKQQQIPAAIVVLEQLAQIDTQQARDHLTKLCAYANKLQRNADALRYAQELVRRSPADAEAMERLAELYERAHDHERAASGYRSALLLSDRLFSAQLALAQLLYAYPEETAETKSATPSPNATPPNATLPNTDAAATANSARQEITKLLLHVVTAASEPEHLEKALQLARLAGLSQTLEPALARLAVERSGQRIYRHLLLEVYLASGVQRAAEPKTRPLLKPLLDALSDSVLTDQRAAVELLSELKSPEASQALFSYALSDADAELRLRAMLAFGATRNESMLKGLNQFLLPDQVSVSEDAPLNLAAVIAVAKLSSSAAQATLLKLTFSPAAGIRALAALSLRPTLHPGALPRLTELLSTEYGPLTRAAAAATLGTVWSEKTKPQLIRALLPLRSDPEPLTRRTAQRALAQLATVSSPAAMPAQQALRELRTDAAQELLNPEPEARRFGRRLAVLLLPNSAQIKPNSETHGENNVRIITAAATPAWETVTLSAAGIARVLETLPTDVNKFETPELQQRALLELAPELAVEFLRQVNLTPQSLPQLAELLLYGALEHMPLPFQTQLLTFSEHTDPAIRTAALRLLFALLPPQTTSKPFARQHETSSPEQLEHFALISQRLAAALAGDPPRVVEPLLHALQNNPRTELLPAIASCLTPERPWSLRVLAIHTLAAFPAAPGTSREASDATRAMYATINSELTRAAQTDPVALVRLAATQSLFHLFGGSAQQVLSRVAKRDPEPEVRHQASLLLAQVAKTLEQK